MQTEFRAGARSAPGGVLNGRFLRRATQDDERDMALIDRAVIRARAGDPEALRFLYLEYADNVYGYVHSIVRDEHEAEDVTQHVFAKLMIAVRRYEQRDVPFTAWVLRVARNVAVDHVRARRAVPVEEVRGSDVHADDTGEECGRSLREALADLPEEQRNVVVLRHVVGLSPGEIADRLGRSESSVHSLHHRARGTMVRRLSELGAAPSTHRVATLPAAA